MGDFARTPTARVGNTSCAIIKHEHPIVQALFGGKGHNLCHHTRPGGVSSERTFHTQLRAPREAGEVHAHIEKLDFTRSQKRERSGLG